jgi:hypothetical protein
MSWVVRVLAVLGLAVVGWALLTEAPAVRYGHPAYAVLLGLTVLGAAWALWLHRRARPAPGGWRRVGSVALVLGAVGWLAAAVYLRPFSAEEPALAAMVSDDRVQVRQSATRIVLEPIATSAPTAVLFQPGARVDARAYAAVLRPLAEAGHRVFIVKQPLGIAFLATGALDDIRAAQPDEPAWVVGGHSLGGTVAAIQADAADEDPTAPVTGLLLYASYPASDLSDSLRAQVLSISGSNDGLATPADIEASRADLPADAGFEVIEGAVHAFFGDYGPQPGDGQPTISHDEARTQITNASMQLVREAAAGRVFP